MTECKNCGHYEKFHMKNCQWKWLRRDDFAVDMCKCQEFE